MTRHVFVFAGALALLFAGVAGARRSGASRSHRTCGR